MKKKQKLNKIYILVVFVVIGVILFNYYKNSSSSDIQVVSKIDGYNYVLDSNETRVYKKYFKELENILSSDKIDEEEYASLITKLFIIDFYTLNNKITNQDVGGLQFIHSNIKDEFYFKAVNTIYKYVKSNLYGNRNQKLPDVKDVLIDSIDKDSFDSENIKDNDMYIVKVKIKYVKELDYPDSVTIKVVHEDNKLSIIEVE